MAEHGVTADGVTGDGVPPGSPDSFHAAIGGTATFTRLVEEFYARVAQDDVLRPMYPSDLAPAGERLRMFLEQYWGGPTTYGEQRGHPRLRLRHAPFPIDGVARDRWLTHMRAALETLDLPPRAHAQLWDYLERAAHSMVNQGDL